MLYDVHLNITDATTGIGTTTDIRLDVSRAESGLYIASNSTISPILAAGKTPRHAILDYLGDLFYSRTTEAEMATNTPGDEL